MSVQPKTIEKSCKECGKQLGPYQQFFCSAAHQGNYNARKRRLDGLSKAALWIRENRYGLPIEGLAKIGCEECGSEFFPRNRKHKFCSKACKDRVGNRRRGSEYSNLHGGRSVKSFIRCLINKKKRQELTLEYCMQIYFSQEGKCAITGEEMTHVRGKGRVLTNISIDRIDPNIGYVEGNIQFVTHKVNLLKSDMQMEDLYKTCELVLQKKKGRDSLKEAKLS